MTENIKILKIIGEIKEENRLEIIEDVKSIKGVLDCIIVEENGETLLKYAIDKWSSDYDILVAIMNGLADNYDLESEMYDTAIEDEEDYIIVDKTEENTDFDNDYEEENHSCHCDNHNHGSCGCDHHEHGSCGCGHEHSAQEIKTKIIELGVSVLLLIVGVILNAIPTTEEFAKYLFVLSYAAAGYEILFDGLVNIFKGKVFNENLLMSLASLSAIILGEFVESAGIMILFSIGELFEHSASNNAKKVIDGLKDFSPKTVNIIGENGEIIVKKPEEVEVNDIILIKSGERVVIDGEVIEGTSSFDTKTITGESNYKDVKVGDTVYGDLILELRAKSLVRSIIRQEK
jgi:Cd2+/Zn2+-exporting ATPase